MRFIPEGIFLFATALGTASLGFSQASEKGEWTDAVGLPLPAIHSVLLPPDGHLMLYSYQVSGGSGTWCWTLDPDTFALSAYPLANINVFCGGHSLLANGEALIVGGTGGHFNTGHDKTFVFSEPTGFVQHNKMKVARWYPTVTRLGDGRFIVMAGLDNGGTDTPLVEVLDPQSMNWSKLVGAGKKLPLYPMNFLIPTGEIVAAGPHKRTEALDPVAEVWRYIDDTAKDHNEGSAVLLPPYPDRIMVLGGHNLENTVTRKMCEILDLSAPNPQWRKTTPMIYRRQHHNAVLLPDGKVLVVGGRQNEKDVDYRGKTEDFFRAKAVREAELFDPVTETWKLMAAQARPRLYHSTAILLKDGRVFTCGGEQEPSGEVYSPPYLFQGPRPTLTGVPQSVGYGDTFVVQSDQADKITSACLIAPGATTHSFDQNQRFVAVDVVDLGGGSLQITAPALGAVAPPGYYLLFIVNDQGVPSVGEFLQVL